MAVGTDDLCRLRRKPEQRFERAAGLTASPQFQDLS